MRLFICFGRPQASGPAVSSLVPSAAKWERSAARMIGGPVDAQMGCSFGGESPGAARCTLGELVQVQGYCTTAATRMFLISSTRVPAVSVPAVSRCRGCWARALQVQVGTDWRTAGGGVDCVDDEQNAQCRVQMRPVVRYTFRRSSGGRLRHSTRRREVRSPMLALANSTLPLRRVALKWRVTVFAPTAGATI